MPDEFLREHLCLEAVDRVSGDPETTTFKRRARLQQALWREQRGYPIGTQPIRPTPRLRSRPLGSRIELDAARRDGLNFINATIRKAVANRLAHPQPHQTLDEDRLYCDLLSSMPMCFNLFGGLAEDLALADQAVHTWWPDVQGTVTDVRFEWSPGRRLPGEYLENRSAFDVAFILEQRDGKHGVIGVETKYHENCKKEKRPTEERLGRYAKITAEAGIMSSESVDAIVGTELQQIWLDHLLAASMPLHVSGQWHWAKFVLVHPARNPSFARAFQEYRKHLIDPESMGTSTIESLLDACVLPVATSSAFRERYLW